MQFGICRQRMRTRVPAASTRTSRAGRNQHDNDLTTFHRVKNFRERTAFLLPGKK